ncbi:MAG: hypothetical protein LBD15_01155 [Holosporales bacterium]|jgi:hypothetical protein|nr:hypothetical protein [Holosporales bacterium]
MPNTKPSDLLRDLEALYEASLSAASFGTALKVKELIVRLEQSKKSSSIPNIADMTDDELNDFISSIKEQLATARKQTVKKIHRSRIRKIVTPEKE